MTSFFFNSLIEYTEQLTHVALNLFFSCLWQWEIVAFSSNIINISTIKSMLAVKLLDIICEEDEKTLKLDNPHFLQAVMAALSD